MEIDRLNTSNDNTVSSLTSILASCTSIADEYDRFNGKFALECVTAIGALITAAMAVFGVFWKSEADRNNAYLIVSVISCFIPIIVNIYLFVTSFHNRRTEVFRCYLIHIEEELECLTGRRNTYNYHRDALYRGMLWKFFPTNFLCGFFVVFLIILCYVGAIFVFNICIGRYEANIGLQRLCIVVGLISFGLNFLFSVVFMCSNLHPHDKIMKICKMGIDEEDEKNINSYRRWTGTNLDVKEGNVNRKDIVKNEEGISKE